MNIYQSTVPFWRNNLQCLKAILAKAAGHAEQQGYDGDVLVATRLFPDMFPLARQVQVCCDVAARAGARLAQTDLPNFPDTETSLDELRARVDGALSFLAGLDPAAFDGAEQRQIEVPVGGGNTMPMTGHRYAFSFATPNFYFHLTTAYNLLRSNGVPLSKRDFLVAPE